MKIHQIFLCLFSSVSEEYTSTFFLHYNWKVFNTLLKSDCITDKLFLGKIDTTVSLKP